MDHAGTDRLDTLIPAISLAGLGVRLGLHVAARTDLAQTVWFARVSPVLAALMVEIIRILSPGEVMAGQGVFGLIDGRPLIVGGDGFGAGRVGRGSGDHPELAAGSVMVAVAVDGRMAGHLVMADPLREGAADMLAKLRQQGITRILLATRDRAEVGLSVTGILAAAIGYLRPVEGAQLQEIIDVAVILNALRIRPARSTAPQTPSQGTPA